MLEMLDLLNFGNESEMNLLPGFAAIMSKRQQRNLHANFRFMKKSKTNNSEELHGANFSGDVSLRTNTAAAPAGTAAGESKPTAGPGVTT